MFGVNIYVYVEGDKTIFMRELFFKLFFFWAMDTRK